MAQRRLWAEDAFILQSLVQLKQVYAEGWETFPGQCRMKIFFSVGDQFTRDYISKFIGDAEVVRLTRNVSPANGTTLQKGTAYCVGSSLGVNWGKNQGSSTGGQSGWNSSRNKGGSRGTTTASINSAAPAQPRRTAAAALKTARPTFGESGGIRTAAPSHCRP